MTKNIYFLSWQDKEEAFRAYDSIQSAVVIASTEEEARRLVQEQTMDEGLYALEGNWKDVFRHDREAFLALMDKHHTSRRTSPFWASDKFSKIEIVGVTADSDSASRILNLHTS